MSTTGLVARVFLASMIASQIFGTATPALAKPPLDKAIIRQKSRNDYVKFESIVEALRITDGMTILDIGSGPGYASFLFAEKLQGTGAVYATDIRKDFVDHINGEAGRRGLRNLSAHVVKEAGFDEFYRRHRYDLVFLSNVYHCLDDRIGYFRELRGLLNERGRLVLVMYNQVPLFSEDDFPETGDIVEILSRNGGDNPFYRQLSEGTRQLMKGNADPEGLDRGLVDDFNRMLVNPRFYKSFYDNSYFAKNLFTEPERDLANWLLMTLREDGVLDKPADRLDAKERRAVVKLNRLFFVKRFGDALAEDGKGAYVPAGDANRNTSKYVMLRELGAAGYKIAEEIRLSPYFDAIVMVPAAP